MESGMAVGSFMKSSGITALAIGLAMSLPMAASAQERGQRDRGQQAEQNRGARAEARTERRSVRSEARTENRASRVQARQQAPQVRSRVQAPEARTQVQVRSQAQRQAPPQAQARVRWGSPAAAGVPLMSGTARQQDSQRRWDGNRDRDRADRTRDYDRNQARGGDGRRWDNDRDRTRDGNRWSGNDQRRWDNNWRRDNRYNWQHYRSSNRNVFRLGRYYAPYNNWNYRRLSIGFSLQPLFYSSNYWINDPWRYRLPEAYGPYRWVRYYDDALLVDIYTGRVVDVLHDFFW
jgi:hypothetical protein